MVLLDYHHDLVGVAFLEALHPGNSIGKRISLLIWLHQIIITFTVLCCTIPILPPLAKLSRSCHQFEMNSGTPGCIGDPFVVLRANRCNNKVDIE